MKKHHKIAIGVLTAASLLSAGTVAHYSHKPAPPVQPPVSEPVSSPVSYRRVGPDYLYPNSTVTPGKADTLDPNDLTKKWPGNLTYSQYHRNVPSSEKDEVCKEYVDNCKIPKEIDHFYPLCAGGSNDIQNLWAQPEKNDWNGVDYGYKKKDKLESWVCIQIKVGKMIPADAYAEMTRDWVQFYQEFRSQIESSP